MDPTETNSAANGMETEPFADDMQTVRLDEPSRCVYIGTSSVVGQREEQQDAIKADPYFAYFERGRAIAILCDGMGGMTGGARASALCSSIVYSEFYKEDAAPSIPAFYKAAIMRADDEVNLMKDDEGRPITGAGTTLASVVFDGDQLFWASVGDSRIYIIRDGQILCITKDHNYLMLLSEKVKKGELTREEAESDSKKEALISYIGMGGVAYIDMSAKGFPLKNGDYIVLCSDGLYRSVPEEEIKAVVCRNGTETNLSATELTALAMSKNLKNQDNTSVIVVAYEELASGDGADKAAAGAER